MLQLWACTSLCPFLRCSDASPGDVRPDGLSLSFLCVFFLPKGRGSGRREGGGKNQSSLCKALGAQDFSVRDPHIKGSIYVFAEGHMEVTQMLLRCAMVLNEAILPTRVARAGQHTGPEWAISAPVNTP